MTPIEELQNHLLMMLITFSITFPVMYYYWKNEKGANLAGIAFFAGIASFPYVITLFCITMLGFYELYRFTDRKILKYLN